MLTREELERMHTVAAHRMSTQSYELPCDYAVKLIEMALDCPDLLPGCPECGGRAYVRNTLGGHALWCVWCPRKDCQDESYAEGGTYAQAAAEWRGICGGG